MQREQITIQLPEGLKASDKWQDGQDTEGKYLIRIVPMCKVVQSGTAKDKQADGTTKERPWTYDQLALVSDGRKTFAGGQCIGQDHETHPITIKTLVKRMPKASDKVSSPSVTKTYTV